MPKPGKCEHDGCNSKDAQLWSIDGYDPLPEFVFCIDHAIEFGFCPSCGQFIGGTEDTFRTERTNLCLECFLYMQREEERAMDMADHLAEMRESWDDDEETP